MLDQRVGLLGSSLFERSRDDTRRKTRLYIEEELYEMRGVP
jgi:hypothetical protein